MSTQPLYESDEVDDNTQETQPPTPDQPWNVLSSRLSDISVWSRLSDWDPYIVAMDSEKPFCTPPMYDGPGDSRKATGFYNVYVGDLPGCYRDWASAGSRVIGYPNNHHKKYATYEEAMEGWKQYCLSHHQHSDDFKSGSLYQALPRASTAPPSSIPPQSQHNVVVVPSPKKHVGEKLAGKLAESSPSPLSTPTKKLSRVPKSHMKPNDAPLPKNKSSAANFTSPSSSISSPSSLTSSSPSVHDFFGSQPSTSTASISNALPPRRRYWAVHSKSFNSVVHAEEADRMLWEGQRRGERVLVQEVSGVVDAESSSSFHDSLDPIPEDELVVAKSSVIPAKRYRKSDYPLLHWADHCRDDALKMFLTVEARSDPDIECCSSCPVGKEEGPPEFQCVDCFSRQLTCASCCVRRHRDKPLDKIKVGAIVAGLRVELDSILESESSRFERVTRIRKSSALVAPGSAHR
ncbi:hypothetical protein EV360DRAFT_76011 [Lentinula raphanica]|nr:hypothetical protein EV360DRAFT_76011 [Lentinula raphanica]